MKFNYKYFRRTNMNRGIVLWSGGKDCTIALHKARLSGIEVTHLLPIIYNMPELNVNTYTVHSSGLSKEILQKQAESLGCELVPYELPNIYDFTVNGFIEFLKNKTDVHNLTHIITGEGGNPSMGLWFTHTASSAGLTAVFPNTHSEDNCLTEAKYIIDSGYKCKVVSTDDQFHNDDLLGREYDYALIELFSKFHNKLDRFTNPVSAGTEFHTVAYDGPEFKFPIKLEKSEIKTITTNFHDEHLNKTTNIIHFLLFR